MSERLDVDNPFYDNDASSSAFGWDFQINAAIFLFLKYLKQVENVKVEGKHQDIELQLVDKSCIFAQAKSVQNGSNDNRKSKIEDAIISLVKTSVNNLKNDKLLYISNYKAPIKDSDLYSNQIVALKNVKNEQSEFKIIVNDVIRKLNNKLNCENLTDIKTQKYSKLIKRLEDLNDDDFLICSIIPYLNTEIAEDKYKVIKESIQEKLTSDFNINSSNIIKYVKKILENWQTSFLLNATIPDRSKEKLMTKLQLMLQIIAIISENDIDDLQDLLSFELTDDIADEYSQLYSNRTFYHDRFDFINRLYDDYKKYTASNIHTKSSEFVQKNWTNYKDEYTEFTKDNDIYAQEYLIKRDLIRLLRNNKNIKKVIDGVDYDN